MDTSGPSTTGRSMSYSSAVPAPAPTSRNNPISLRIYKAIGTSFDDEASRQALEIASGLYSGKGKAKELDHDEYDIDEEDDPAHLRRAGKGESAAMARKWLKRDIEGRLASSSQKFLEAFGEVDKVGLLVRLEKRAKGRNLMSCGSTCKRCRSVATRFSRSWIRRTAGRNIYWNERMACDPNG